MADQSEPEDTTDDEPPPPFSGEAPLRRHIQVFAVCAVVVVGLNLLTGTAVWLYWAVAGWAMVALMHWLYVRSVNVDDAWVEERTADLRDNAYDRGHIEDIEKRHQKRPSGEAPSDEPPRV